MYLYSHERETECLYVPGTVLRAFVLDPTNRVMTGAELLYPFFKSARQPWENLSSCYFWVVELEFQSWQHHSKAKGHCGWATLPSGYKQPLCPSGVYSPARKTDFCGVEDDGAVWEQVVSKGTYTEMWKMVGGKLAGKTLI